MRLAIWSLIGVPRKNDSLPEQERIYVENTLNSGTCFGYRRNYHLTFCFHHSPFVIFLALPPAISNNRSIVF